MKLTGVTCVKNEADIIEPFVRHNLSFLDNLIVLDHGSTDETPAILRSLQREGLALQILLDETPGKLQGEKMTFLMRLAAGNGSDWIFLLDGDEFIKSPSGLPLSLPDGTPGVLKVAVETYCARPDDSVHEINPVIRMGHRLASEPFQNASPEERRFYLHCVVHRDVALTPGCEVLQGSHQVMRQGVELDHILYEDFSLAHYSLRSPGQYASKISIGTLQHLARTTLAVPGDSFYTSHLETLRRDFDAFAGDFYRRLPAYIEIRGHPDDKVNDPLVYSGGPLKYTPSRSDFATLTSNLLGYSESLARNLGRFPALSHDIGKNAVRLTLKDRDFPSGTYCSLNCYPTPLNTEVVVLPLKNWNGIAMLLLEIHAPTSYLEFVSVALLMKDGTRRGIPGSALRSCFKVFTRSQGIFHGSYFTFVKAMSSAEILVDFRKFSKTDSVNAMELGFRFDKNPTIIGLRFFQEDPFIREEELEEVFRGLRKKHRNLTRIRGFLRHHIRSLLGRINKEKQG